MLFTSCFSVGDCASSVDLTIRFLTDTMTMVLDPSAYYTNGSQKMYRLVNLGDVDHGYVFH